MGVLNKFIIFSALLFLVVIFSFADDSGLLGPELAGVPVNEWTSPVNMKLSDNLRTIVNGLNQVTHGGGYPIGLSNQYNITGIMVTIEGRCTSISCSGLGLTCDFGVELTFDNGSTYSDQLLNTYECRAARSGDQTKTFGNSTHLWGETEILGDALTNNSFFVRMESVARDAVMSHTADHLAVTVYYTYSPTNPCRSEDAICAIDCGIGMINEVQGKNRVILFNGTGDVLVNGTIHNFTELWVDAPCYVEFTPNSILI